MRSALVAAGLVTAVASVGCVDRGPGPPPKKIEPSYVAEHLLAHPPTGEFPRLEVPIGGKVVYLGNAIDKPTVAPGQTVRVTHYWRVVEPVGAGWRVFALVRGAPNTADFMNLTATDMEIAHGPASWKAGELIEDIQDVTLRPDWRSATATVYVGLIATGEHGVGDRMAASGRAHPGSRGDRARDRRRSVEGAAAPGHRARAARARADHDRRARDGARVGGGGDVARARDGGG